MKPLATNIGKLTAALTFTCAGLYVAAQPAQPGAPLVQAAQRAASTVAGGRKLGGSVTVMAVWGGAEQQNFLAAVKPFEEATGVKVDYEGTRDIVAVLTTRVQGGNAPAVAGIPSVGLLQEWAEQGKLLDLDALVGATTLKSNFAPGWLELGGYKGKTFGLMFTASLKGLVWYNPRTYRGPTSPKSWDELLTWSERTAKAGTTPWCVGVESGPATGWPATDFIENVFLRQSGPQKYDQWYQGKLPWTSPEVRSAFQAFGRVAADPAMVYGGPKTVLATNFGDAGTPLFNTPPGCFLHQQASFITSLFEKNKPGLKPVADYNFFVFPDINPQFAGSVEVAGDMFGVFRDTPQSRALIRYLATPEAQAIWPSLGGPLAPNRRVAQSAYPDALSRSAARVVAGAKNVRFDASDLMPPRMLQAFWKAVLDYIQNPGRLEAILAEAERARKEAY